MAMASRAARNYGVILGAHPSYPDRENFGRKSLSMPPEALRTSLLEQIGSLQFLAEHFDMDVKRVKPHGALYNDAHRDRALAGRHRRRDHRAQSADGHRLQRSVRNGGRRTGPSHWRSSARHLPIGATSRTVR